MLPISLTPPDFQKLLEVNPLAAEQVKAIALTRMVVDLEAQLGALKQANALLKAELSKNGLQPSQEVPSAAPRS